MLPILKERKKQHLFMKTETGIGPDQFATDL
jgi:hypothetical protein